MNIIFMGTPDFAVEPLRALADSRHRVTLVVTQPDRVQGRGRKIVKSAVKECAEALGIPVFQPEKVRRPEAVERLRQEAADAIVVAAYGQILPEEILNMPRYGCINIHGSLLPAYRGAAPVQWAVINGEAQSGVTIMQMDKGLDTGDILLQKAVALDPKETAASLYDKLSAIGGPLLLEALDEMEGGTITRTPQDGAKSNYAKMLQKNFGFIDWKRPAAVTERLVRGLNSWPSAYTRYDGKQLKIWDSDVTTDKASAAPGTVKEVGRDYFTVNTGDGVLRVNEVQMEGKKRMPVHDFLLGYHLQAGEQLGD